eukprot:GCRY01000284.1.p1 GENE.GCRY01000284.1~~GCRY01000284.1.p1  ORF type:complete len:223 (-),score=40.29 GCRY01000284.1:36-704(-)
MSPKTEEEYFSLINSSLEKEEYGHISDLCFEMELDEVCENTRYEEMYFLELFSLLYIHQINKASFLWKRLPKTLKSNPNLSNLWKIEQAMWVKDHKTVLSLCKTLEFSEQYQKLLLVLKDAYEKKVLDLISFSYTSIEAEKLSSILACSTPAEFDEVIAKTGWSREGSFVIPTKPSPELMKAGSALAQKAPRPSPSAGEAQALTSLDSNLKQLVEYACWLER